MCVDSIGANSAGELGEDGFRAANADDEVGATRLERAAEVSDGVAEEGSAVRASAVEAGGGFAEVARVEEVDWENGEGVVGGGGEGIVVVDAEVAAEPYDGAAAAGDGVGGVGGAAREERERGAESGNGGG